MFPYVNELAVVASAIFMVAVAMVWYSEYLFLKPWMRAVGFSDEDLEAAAHDSKRNFVITFVSYLITILLIALCIGYAQVYGLSVKYIALGLVTGFASLFAGFVLWEQRTLQYYFITVGFTTVFIIGSIFILYEWPW